MRHKFDWTLVMFPCVIQPPWYDLNELQLCFENVFCCFHPMILGYLLWFPSEMLIQKHLLQFLLNSIKKTLYKYIVIIKSLKLSFYSSNIFKILAMRRYFNVQQKLCFLWGRQVYCPSIGNTPGGSVWLSVPSFHIPYFCMLVTNRVLTSNVRGSVGLECPKRSLLGLPSCWIKLLKALSYSSMQGLM